MVFLSSNFLFQIFNPRNPYSSTRLFHNLTNFNFSSNISVIPDVGKSDLITFGNTEAFQTLSTSDLANCKRLGKTFFFCEGRSILQTNIVQDCLGSLYLGTATLVKDNCKFCIDNTRPTNRKKWKSSTPGSIGQCLCHNCSTMMTMINSQL